MKVLLIEPNGWPCKLSECPAGHFTWGDNLGFKSEYRRDGKTEAYNEGGEFFCPPEPREDFIVQPVVAVWRDEDMS